jgi:hypothetical protein
MVNMAFIHLCHSGLDPESSQCRGDERSKLRGIKPKRLTFLLKRPGRVSFLFSKNLFKLFTYPTAFEPLIKVKQFISPIKTAQKICQDDFLLLIVKSA